MSHPTVSVADVFHAFMYAGQMGVAIHGEELFVLDRMFMLNTSCSASRNWLLTGIARILMVKLASHGAMVLVGADLDIYIGRHLKKTPNAVRFTAESFSAKCVRMAKHPVASICVHMDSLWNIDVRWLLLRALLMTKLENAVGTVICVSPNRFETSDSLTLMATPPSTGLVSWSWKASKLRRFMLYGTSAAEDPFPSITITRKSLRDLVLTGYAVTVTWFTGTTTFLTSYDSLTLECTLRLAPARTLAVLSAFVPVISKYSSIHLLVLRMQSGSHIFVCSNQSAVDSELSRWPSAVVDKAVTWTPDGAASFEEILNEHLGNVHAVALRCHEEIDVGLYEALYKSTCEPLIASNELATCCQTLHFEKLNFILNIVEDAPDHDLTQLLTLSPDTPVRKRRNMSLPYVFRVEDYVIPSIPCSTPFSSKSE